MRHVLLGLLVAATALTGCDGTAPEEAAGPDAGVTAGPAPPPTPPPTSAPASPPTGASTATSDPAGEPCSAAGLSPEPVEQPELPEPVRDLRRRVVQAAVSCDLEQLAALATSGSGDFTYSFGGGGDPAGHWRQEEQAGRDPLRLLVEVLDLPAARLDRQAEVQYVWPSAFAYADWESVPAEDKQALEPLYSQDELEGFARFGGYAGYRVGMTPGGDWLFFVAGD